MKLSKISPILVAGAFLAGCSIDVEEEEFKEHNSQRMVEKSEEHCEPHGGVFKYKKPVIPIPESDYPKVVCFNGSEFDIRTGEAE